MVAGVAAAALITTSVSATEISISDKERASLEMRVMQSELMVAALACSSSANYNAFVTRYKNELTNYGKTMQDLFKRVHGGNAFSQINSFVTRVANEASLKMAQNSHFCEEAGQMFQTLLQSGTSGGIAALDNSRNRYRCMPITGFSGSNCAMEARGTLEAKSAAPEPEKAR
ncbi:MAG: hypothetical protein K0Q70_2661 [Rhodospirillales bacterium]|jgi:hypothetical protein|nr:hypothetical protein [Rhodospirillales bacterium]MCE3258201.1 hypothetical protein [Nitrobacter vulgaris]